MEALLNYNAKIPGDLLIATGQMEDTSSTTRSKMSGMWEHAFSTAEGFSGSRNSAYRQGSVRPKVKETFGKEVENT